MPAFQGRIFFILIIPRTFMKPKNLMRRTWFKHLTLLSGLIVGKQVHAHHTETHFEDSSPHRLIMNCNQSNHDYLSHTLFSVGELLRKYGDDIEIIVECYGPGIHLVGKKPKRSIDKTLQQKVSSLLQYGVAFHACNNTMSTLNWTKEDLFDGTKIVDSGIEDIMLLQEKGFAYASW